MKRFVPTLVAVLISVGIIVGVSLWPSKIPDRVKPTTPNYYVQPMIPFTLINQNGSTALEFGTWIIVFEGIPARKENANRKGAFWYDEPIDEGLTMTAFYNWAGIELKQSAGKSTAITFGGYEFKLMEAGKKLAFAAQTYEAKESTRTIIVGKDGSTRELTQ